MPRLQLVGLLEPAPADSCYHPHPSDELLAAVANTSDLGKLTPKIGRPLAKRSIACR